MIKVGDKIYTWFSISGEIKKFTVVKVETSILCTTDKNQSVWVTPLELEKRWSTNPDMVIIKHLREKEEAINDEITQAERKIKQLLDMINTLRETMGYNKLREKYPEEFI